MSHPTLGSSNAAIYGARHKYHVVIPVVFQCWVNVLPPTLSRVPLSVVLNPLSNLRSFVNFFVGHLQTCALLGNRIF
jgi:hypothetical protein